MENAIFSHQHQAVGSVGVGRRPVMLVSDRDRNDPMDVYAARQEQYAAGVDAMDRSLLSARTPQPAYTEAAVAVVHQLAEQLTTKDAPPSNQAWNINPASTDLHERYSTSSATHSKHTAASGSFPVSAASATTMHSSRQSSPTELLAGASSFDTDVSSLGPSQFFQDLMLVQHDPDGAAARWNMALRRAEGGTLGHASLQALCASTLQQVGVDLEDTVPLQIETELLLMQGQLSAPASTASNKQSSPKRKLRFWKRPTAVKGAFDVAMQQQVLEPVVRQRLCQFGSDYARHLSNTALAPEHCQPRGSNRRSNGRHRRSSAATSAHKRSLQDADHQVLSGAILDICVTFGSDAAPVGYYCLDQTATGQTVNWTATASNGGGKKNKAVHLHVKKEAVWDKAAQRPCVTALAVIFPDRQEFVPPGFCIVRRYPATAVSGSKPTCGSSSSNNAPANLNQGTGERVYLCFRRSREGNPLTGIVPLRPDFAEQVPVGYTVLEKTPRNHSADLLRGTGPPVFLAYRQRLANLETLRPLPLVLSVQSQQHHNASVFEDDDGSDFQQPQVQHRLLQAYYATGGTVVAADVGRFHIMDRSTHSLLSPSSVSNRLKLIEKSRRKAAGESEPDQTNRTAATQTNTSLRGLQKMEYNDESSVGDFESVGSSSRRNSLANDYASKGSFATMEQGSIDSVGDSIDVPSIILSALLGSREIDGGIQAIFGSEDPELLQCLEAMRFIPGVDTATHGLPKIQATQRLQARAALLTPILTACYTRHGGAALVAVDGLTTLLKQNFFDDDVDVTDESDNGSSTRLTLLDLAIQSVCDVATSGAQETTFGSCVEFVEHAVRFSQGQLNTRTIGFVVRFYLFVFCFGVSIPTSSSRWPSPLWQPPSLKESGEANQPDDDVPMLLDPRTEGSRSYLPGGAPQAAALAFKELLSLSIVRLGKVSVTDVVVLAQGSSGLPTSVSCGKDIQEPGDVADSLLSSLVDNAVNHVEIANYTQLALHQVQRSGGSELFWHDMIHSCGSALFGNDNKLGEAGRDIYTMIFAVMANLVKASSGKVGTNANRSELLPRDVASKLLSLELLLHFLENWSDEQEAVNGIESVQSSGSGRSIHTLAFSIRRMVVPCLLSNTRAALEDPQVFKRVMRIISELWCSPVYRKHCKAELGILFEHFALRLLQMGPQLIAARKVDLWSDQATISLLSQQVDLLKEVKNWFSYDPKDVIELYLNYDTDISQQIGGPIHLLPGTQLKFFQRLCSGLSNIAEQCGELIGDQIRENQSKIMSRSEEVGGDLSELLTSLEETKGEAIDKTTMRESARLLRKTSLEAISQIVKALAISAASATGSEFTSLLLSWTPADSVIAFQSTYASSPTTERREGRASSRLGCTNGEGDDEILEFWRSAIAKENKERLSDASPSSEEALKTAFDIAERKSLKKAVEYLIACNSLTPAPRDIANFLRLQKEHLDPAGLGNYLGECGMGGAETEYWNSVRHYYVRAISFSGMNVEEGLRHFLTNCGFRLPGEAQKIDRIMNTFAQCYFEDNAGDTQRCPFKEEDTIYLLSFAIIMLNTDLHKSCRESRKTIKRMTKVEFISNLKGVAQGEDINRDYLSVAFDSIAADPIAMHDSNLMGKSASEDRQRTLQDMLNNVRSGDALLRGLAVHDFNFASIGDFAASLEYKGQDALSDLTRSCVAKTWHQWHGVVNTGLETAHLDPQGMKPCVEILLYALSITTLLDMPTERAAFLAQLGRLKAFEERRHGRWVTTHEQLFHNEDWYLKLEQACAGTKARKLWALREIRTWMVSLQSALQVDVQNKVEMARAVLKLKEGDFLLLDPGRSFVRDGDLVKRSGRTGRSTPYRFFLFSDVLLYASGESNGRYKMHEELPLHLMKVTDWFPASQKKRDVTFEVHHPRKKFQVVCNSVGERKEWVQDIRAAIKGEMVRKMKMEAARLAAHG